MKSRVSNQRYLKAMYEDAAVALGELRITYGEMMMSWVINNEKLKDPGYNIPADPLRQMNRLFGILRNRYPGGIPKGMEARERKAKREGSR